MSNRQRGSRYGGPDSVRPAQPQEGDLANEGGTAPGGTVAFMGAASQWSTSPRANAANEPVPDPIKAAHMMHVGLADEAPSAKGDAPVHPGLAPGLFRTARDANYTSPDGRTTNIGQGANDPTANDGRGQRGVSPEVLKQTRGGYRP